MIENFSQLNVKDGLAERLEQLRITQPTPVQIKSIPYLLEQRDVIAQAQTGTGKTLAFMLPVMQLNDPEAKSVQSLIITPTRELALQITNEAQKLMTVDNIGILSAYGGQDVEKQLAKLKNNISVVIGTPGRILDLIRRESLDLSNLKRLVLDEADQMLHMGFIDEVDAIIRNTPSDKQVMCFSATFNKEVKKLAKQYMNEPHYVSVKGENITLDEINQIIVKTTDRKKQDALCTMIDKQQPFMAIIFCRTKRRVIALNEALKQKGYNCDELHGDMSQAKRERVMKDFRNAKIQLLIATDVAARGLDIEGVTHVYNYDMVLDTDSYIHRIGRTGRAGEKGVAVTFVTPKHQLSLKSLTDDIKTHVEIIEMDKPKDDKREEYRGGRKMDNKDNSKDIKKEDGKDTKKERPTYKDFLEKAKKAKSPRFGRDTKGPGPGGSSKFSANAGKRGHSTKSK